MIYNFPKTVYRGDFKKIEEEFKEAYDEYFLYGSKENTKLELIDLMMSINTLLIDEYKEEEIEKGMKQLYKKLKNRGVIIE